MLPGWIGKILWSRCITQYHTRLAGVPAAKVVFLSDNPRDVSAYATDQFFCHNYNKCHAHCVNQMVQIQMNCTLFPGFNTTQMRKQFKEVNTYARHGVGPHECYQSVQADVDNMSLDFGNINVFDKSIMSVKLCQTSPVWRIRRMSSVLFSVIYVQFFIPALFRSALFPDQWCNNLSPI